MIHVEGIDIILWFLCDEVLLWYQRLDQIYGGEREWDGKLFHTR